MIGQDIDYSVKRLSFMPKSLVFNCPITINTPKRIASHFLEINNRLILCNNLINL